MNILSVVGIAVITVVMAAVLKEFKAEYAVFVSLCGGLAILAVCLPQISEILQYIKSLTQIGDMNIYFSVVLKSLGIAFIIQICSDICKDMGEDSVASKVEFAGKIAILVVCLPVIKSIISMGAELLS